MHCKKHERKMRVNLKIQENLRENILVKNSIKLLLQL